MVAWLCFAYWVKMETDAFDNNFTLTEFDSDEMLLELINCDSMGLQWINFRQRAPSIGYKKEVQMLLNKCERNIYIIEA